MAVIVIESFFRHCNGMEDFREKYEALLRNFEIASVNQKCQIIQWDQIGVYYEKYLNRYLPVFEDALFNGKIVLVLVASEKETQADYADIGADVIFLSHGLLHNVYADISLAASHIRTIAAIQKVDATLETASEIVRKRVGAEEKLDNELFEDASWEFKQLADLYFRLGLTCTAKDLYAFAAITAERTEKWREISYLWYCAYEPIKGGYDYRDYNSLEHTYPSISFEKWLSFDDHEKKGRALQYSAYSSDNHNGPSDSYWIYESAAQEYMKADNYQRTIECAVSATNRYASCFHTVKPGLISMWKKLLRDPRASEYSELLYISFSDIYRNLNLYHAEEADFFYIETKKLQQKRLLEKKKYGRFLLNKLWSALTKYGTSICGIVIVSITFVAVLFPVAYYLCQYAQAGGSVALTLETLHRFGDCVKISVDVFFTTGFAFESSGMLHFFMILEAFYSYVVLVIVSGSMISKLLAQSK